MVVPRGDSEFSRPATNSPIKKHTHQQYHTTELSLDEHLGLEVAELLTSETRAVPQTSPPSCRRVALERHVRHSLPGTNEFPRKRSTRKNWWQEMEHVDLMLAPDLANLGTSGTAPDVSARTRMAPDESSYLTERDEDQHDGEIPLKVPETSNEVLTPRHGLPPVSKASAAHFGRHKQRAKPARSEAPPSATMMLASASIPIHEKSQSRVDARLSSHPSQRLDRCDALTHEAQERQPAVLMTDTTLDSETSHSPLNHHTNASRTATTTAPVTPKQLATNVALAANSAATPARQQLARSESAPETLELHRWTGERQRAKHMRGLCGGLELQPEYHIESDFAARILHKQCEDAFEHSAVRIRYSKSPAAQSLVMQARVRRALGQRPLPAVDASQRPSALVRADRHTMERAVSVLALAEQHRALAHSLSTTDALASGTTLHARSSATALSVPPPH